MGAGRPSDLAHEESAFYQDGLDDGGYRRSPGKDPRQRTMRKVPLALGRQILSLSQPSGHPRPCTVVTLNISHPSGKKLAESGVAIIDKGCFSDGRSSATGKQDGKEGTCPEIRFFNIRVHSWSRQVPIYFRYLFAYNVSGRR